MLWNEINTTYEEKCRSVLVELLAIHKCITLRNEDYYFEVLIIYISPLCTIPFSFVYTLDDHFHSKWIKDGDIICNQYALFSTLVQMSADTITWLGSKNFKRCEPRINYLKFQFVYEKLIFNWINEVTEWPRSQIELSINKNYLLIY